MKEYPIYIQIIDNYIESIYSIFKTNYKECRKNINEDCVHDSRVSLRRLMSISELLSYLLLNEDNSPKNYSKKFKKIQKLFGPVRDIHVSIEYLMKNIIDISNYPEFLEFLSSIRTSNEIELYNLLNDNKIPEILKIKNSLREDFLVNLTEFDFLEVLNICLDDLFLILVEKIENINPSIISTLHDVRISLKQFKYMYEIYILFNKDHETTLKKLSLFQDNLGELQDLNVINKYIEQFEGKKDNMPLLINLINKRKNFLINDFIERKYDVINLWNLTTQGGE